MPVAGLVVDFRQTLAGAPISSTALLAYFAVRKWSTTGPHAAATMMATATNTQMATIACPRRRSAAFC